MSQSDHTKVDLQLPKTLDNEIERACSELGIKKSAFIQEFNHCKLG